MKTKASSISQRNKYLCSLKDLEDSHIINAAYRCSYLSPLSLLEDSFSFKLYPCDVGLMLSSLLKGDGEEAYKKIRFGKLDGANFGTLYECIVAQSLVMKNRKIFYRTFELNGKRYEIDFVYLSKGKVTAVETKPTMRFTTSSLDALKSKYPQLKFNKIVVCPKPMHFDNDISYLPVYMLDVLDI